MKNLKKFNSSFIVFLILLQLAPVFALTGCSSIKLIAEYDEKLDNSVTELQKKVAILLTQLERTAETDEGIYSKYQQSYDGIQVDLSSIRVRAVAIDKNKITQDQIQLLSESIANLEDLHKTGLTREQIPALRNSFEQGFTAILKLIHALKR